jgi:hypothetical protein
MDLVVTVPQYLWAQWVLEGDPAGTYWSGTEWAYRVANKPPIQTGDRLYVVAWKRLRGYAPVTRVFETNGGWAICREGRAVACTIGGTDIVGFRGYQKRWWNRDEEMPFPDWVTASIGPKQLKILKERLPGVSRQYARTLLV